ncbi:MAG: pyridoxal phosphate-dependent aminotransferase [Boseongicola sp.]|nr:pyridoxal phosphate-dependent aminotransferase [Boseongicola sp.]
MTKPPLTPLAESLPASVPFVGPEATERKMGKPFAARLGANENLFGPSPKALTAMAESASEIWKYPDPESHDLRRAIARHLQVAADEVVVGEGIDTLLGYLVRLYVEPGTSVVTSDGAYPTFNYHVTGYGGTLTKVPYKDDMEDPEALLKAASESNARLIYLSNPDNPMGTHHDYGVIDDMIADLNPECLLILDEAYVEFIDDDTVPEIDTTNPNVIRMRTFSKAYGMAGARVGYAFGHRDIVQAFEKVRNHFGLNRTAQIGALAALQDQKYLAKVVQDTADARSIITEIAEENGLATIPSATNFVTIDCGADADFANAVLEDLVARGIFVRKPFAAPGDRCFRVSCGPADTLELFRTALPEALKTAKTR